MAAEANLVKRVIRYVRARGGWIEKVHGGPYQRVGLLDLLCVYRGVPIFAETKAGSKPSPAQLQVIKEVREAGGVALICVNVAQIKNILDQIDTWPPRPQIRYESEGSDLEL